MAAGPFGEAAADELPLPKLLGHDRRYVRLAGRSTLPTQYETRGTYHTYSRVGTPRRVHSQNWGAIETATKTAKTTNRFLPLRNSSARSRSSSFFSSKLIT